MNEPIAWKTTKGALAFCDAKYGKEQGWTPLYACTHPANLTDEEIDDFTARIYNCRTGAEAHEIVLAILRKAQEK